MPPLVHIKTNILPKSKLIVVFSSLAFALLVSFIDQNSIGVALPTIGKDLDAAETIAWAGTSALIANTVFQVLYGRLSDVVGRKVVFLAAVVLLATGDLLCGFAKSGPQLYIFRGIAGVGNGGITALTMMIVSDVVTLEDRGKYQGILGSCVGLGNSIGPFMAAGFVSRSTWRALFWTICPLACVAGVVVAIILPPSKTTGNTKQKMKTIDYCGTFASSIGVLLLLIPISGGGTYFPWDSPMVISMLVLGSVSMIVFVLVEWKLAVMPMMPLHLFQTPAVCAILVQNFFIGIVYYSHLYFLPIYYQNTHQMTAINSAALVIPFVGSQAISSILSGQYISHRKRYGEVIWTGYSLWCLGSILLLVFFNRTIKPYAVALILIIEGAGVGCVFQPTLVAAQAHSAKEDRAVVISVRNFIRALGGAAGLAVSSTIFSNVLNAHTTTLPIALQDHIRNENLGTADLKIMTDPQKKVVLDAYAAASHAAFILYVPVMFICLLLCSFIKDKGLQRSAEKAAAQLSSSEGSIRSLPGTETPADSVDIAEKGLRNDDINDGSYGRSDEKLEETRRI